MTSPQQQRAQPATARVHHTPPVDRLAPRRRQRIRSVASVPAADLVEAAVIGWLHRHSVTLLRLSMGVVIFGFGILKYFPGVSPAENLIATITHLLTFGLVPGRLAMVLLATVECAIGLSLITNRGLRATIYLLVVWVLGILSPTVLLPGRLFSGPDHAPTLEGQYVLKDIILLGASLVIAAATLGRPVRQPCQLGWGRCSCSCEHSSSVNQEWENCNDGASR